jgi:putative DNA primase/helicase
MGTQTIRFKDIALPLAARGVPVIPVQPNDKACFLPDWEKKATTDLAQIEKWNAENPGYNVGCVAKPEGFVILDCDIKGLIKRIEKENGQKFPDTLIVRSAGKGCAHLYFRQTSVSRALGNQKAAGLFDLQSVDKYVVGPGSRLANGKTYDIVHDSPIADFPDWLERWIRDNADVPKKHSNGKDARPVHEDFDFDDFLDFYGIGGHQSGDWFVTDVCPVAGYKHEQSVRTGFFWDGASLGWHCFASGCEGSSMTIGQVIRFLNQKNGGPYDGLIWDDTDADLTDFAEDVAGTDLAPTLLPRKPAVEPKAEVKRGKNGLTPEGEREHAAIQARIAAELAEQKEIEAEIEASREAARDGKEVTETSANGEFEIGESTTREGIIQSLRVIRASDVVTERTEWWWAERIPKGKISLFAGKPGCGKSFVVIDFIARLTTGRDFPNGSKNPWGPRECLLAVSEDDPSDTVVPRLIAAGADLDKVQIILWSTGKKIDGNEPKKRQRMLQLSKDTKLLKKALQENPNIALVAIDPMTSYFGVDCNKDSEIRPIMDALSAACRASKAAFIGVMHYNKKSDVAALEKILGASSIVGSARTVWAFSRDPDDKTERHMSCAKNNLSKNQRGMKYKIGEKLVPFSDGSNDYVGCVEWMGETEEDADEVLAKERDTAKNPKDSKLEEAKMLVQTELANGEQRASSMYRLGEARNISAETMRRGYRSLAVVPYQKNGKWWWALPGMEVREALVAVAVDSPMGDVQTL